MTEPAIPPASADPPPRRRSGSEKRERSASVLVRLTPDERARLEEAANRVGLTLASYARQQTLGGVLPRAARRPPVEARRLALILAALGKIGSNVNQIARAANQNMLSPNDLALLAEETAALRNVRGALMTALGREP